MSTLSLPIPVGSLHHRPYFSELRQTALFFVFMFLLAPMVQAQSQRVFVNELIYDSRQLVGSTFQEVVPNLIEIAGPANTNVASWSLVFYARVTNNSVNINQGRVYGSATISGTIPDQENGYGVLSYTFTPGTLTNDPGGIAVVNASGEVTNFISYEGVPMTALDGPATGLVARQTPNQGSTNGNQSLQLQGTGSIYTDFTWAALFTSTPGQVNKAFINNKQVFVQPTFINITSVSPPVLTERTSNTGVVTVTATRPVVGNQRVSIRGTGIAVGDFGFSSLSVPIASGATSGTVLLQINNNDVIDGTRTLQLEIFNPSESVAIGPNNTISVTVLDDDLPPALSVSPTALSFSTTAGVASAQQSYVLSATALSGSLDVRAPAGFEVSQTSGSGFGPNLSLPGSTTSLTVFVRLVANASAGMLTGTIVNFSGSQTANVAVTGTVSTTTAANQAPVAVSTPNGSATVGIGVNYVVNAFTDPNGDLLTYSASGLPAGLTFNPATRAISGAASTSGVSTVTITGTDTGGLFANTTFTIAVNPAPITPPTNQAPVAVANANQTATAGVNFQFTVAAFTDPNGDVLTYSAIGLPAGLTFNPVIRTISGVASASGVSTVTITGTDTGGLFANTTFTIAVNPAPITPPTNQAPVAVANATQTATAGVNFQFTVAAFTDPNGDVLTYSAIGLPAGLTFNPAIRTISGVASASGVSTVTVTGTDPGGLFATTMFVITINAAPVVNPPVGGSLQLLAPTYNCESGVFTFNTTGGNGSPITFSAIGVVGPTTVNGSNFTDNVDAGLAAEIRRQTATIEPIELIAVQNGVRIVYLWDARTACNGNNPNPPTPPVQGGCGSPANTIGQPLVLLAPTYDCTTGIIRFNTTGGNGSPITFFGVGVTAPITDCVTSADRGNTDATQFTLTATQNGVTSTFFWTRPCAAARVASSESIGELSISVLGNPIQGNMVEFTVRGVEGQLLNISLVDGQGHTVSEVQVPQAGAVERQTLRLGHAAGLYLLRVNTPRQTRTIKVLKQ